MAWFKDLDPKSLLGLSQAIRSYSLMESQKHYADILAHRAEENPVCTYRDILNTVK